MPFNLRNRNFLKLLDFKPEEIRFLLDLAKDLKAAKYAGTEQPRLKVGSWKSRARHYLNLRSTEKKLERILDRFRFGTLAEATRQLQPHAACPLANGASGNGKPLTAAGNGRSADEKLKIEINPACAGCSCQGANGSNGSRCTAPVFDLVPAP